MAQINGIAGSTGLSSLVSSSITELTKAFGPENSKAIGGLLNIDPLSLEKINDLIAKLRSATQTNGYVPAPSLSDETLAAQSANAAVSTKGGTTKGRKTGKPHKGSVRKPVVRKDGTVAWNNKIYASIEALRKELRAKGKESPTGNMGQVSDLLKSLTEIISTLVTKNPSGGTPVTTPPAVPQVPATTGTTTTPRSSILDDFRGDLGNAQSKVDAAKSAWEAASDKDKPMKMLEYQEAYDALNQLRTMLSNILKSLADTNKAIIANMR